MDSVWVPVHLPTGGTAGNPTAPGQSLCGTARPSGRVVGLKTIWDWCFRGGFDSACMSSMNESVIEVQILNLNQNVLKMQFLYISRSD